MGQNLNNNLHINAKEVSREELIKAFEILYEKKLINQTELQRAISIVNKDYKPMRNLIS